MSKIDRHSDLTPSPEEQRILMRALGCGIEELVAWFGAENAIKRVETGLRRARRARSRKLHAFWSAVLVRIETETDEPRNTKPARSARHMATPGNDARTAGLRARATFGVGAEAFRTPAPWASADEHAPVASLLLDL
jgi:hypothetical protein